MSPKEVLLPPGSDPLIRDWFGTGQETSLYDLEAHRTYIDFLLDYPENLQYQSQDYPWRGRFDIVRIWMQNRMMGLGEGHRQHFQHLADAGVSPQSILELTASKDATLVINLARQFPDARIKVVENDSESVTGANRTLMEEGIDLGWVQVFQGEAMRTLQGLSGRPVNERPELIAEQNFTVNLRRRKPESADDNGPTLEGVLEAIPNALAPNGIVVIGGFAPRSLKAYLNPAYQDDPSAQEKFRVAELFTQGDGTFENPGLSNLGWGYRGASIWATAKEIADDVIRCTQGQLRPLEGLSTSLTLVNTDGRVSIGLEYGVPMIIAATHGARVATGSPQLAKLEDWAWRMGREYLKILRDPQHQVLVSLTLHWQTFKKSEK